MKTITPDWPDLPANIRVLSTTRCGGVSLPPYDDGHGLNGLNLGSHVGDDIKAVLANRSLVRAVMPSGTLNYLTQIHGIDIVDAGEVLDGHQADACFTRQVNMPCAVLTADCLPVLICDMQGTVVAALHAGWRGLASGILQAGVARCRQFGSAELTAWMGPAIGANQFEVGQDVFDAFVVANAQVSHFFIQQPSSNPLQTKYLADIYGLARMTLNGAGVHRVHGGEYCTVTQADLFYSYRRNGVTGRMANIIWKTKP